MKLLFLVDKSALARMQHPLVAARLGPIIKAGQAATCGIIDLEVLYSARNHSDYEAIRRRRRLAYVRLPIDDTVFSRAIEVQAKLALNSQHRLPLPDLLIAATAELSGAIVLHYDSDYDRIAAVTGQPTEWVVERGKAG